MVIVVVMMAIGLMALVEVASFGKYEKIIVLTFTKLRFKKVLNVFQMEAKSNLPIFAFLLKADFGIFFPSTPAFFVSFENTADFKNITTDLINIVYCIPLGTVSDKVD